MEKGIKRSALARCRINTMRDCPRSSEGTLLPETGLDRNEISEALHGAAWHRQEVVVYSHKRRVPLAGRTVVETDRRHEQTLAGPQ
jgi:hypothetical protein